MSQDSGGDRGSVSVFFGIIPGRDIFDKYLLGDTRRRLFPMIATRCPFWNDLGVNWLDHDLQDAYYHGDTPVSLDAFLSNPISYVELVSETP